MAELKKARWGVIGATARIAKDAFIPALLRSHNAELAAVASRSLLRAQEIAASCGPSVRAYGDYDSLIADSDVDVIYIPLPNDLHLGWAVEAMNNGKHVLCEKPLALNAVEADEMRETALINRVILSEAFMYRYHPLQREVAALVNDGTLGDVRLVRASFSFMQTDESDYRRDPDMGGGALLDIGCYCVHIARHIFGSEPTIVTAKSLYNSQSLIDTTTTALLEFSEGWIALIDCSFSLSARSSYEVVGSHGSVHVPRFLMGGQSAGDQMESGEYCVSTNGQDSVRHSHPGNMYVGEVEAMSRRILGESADLLSPEDAVQNMRVIDAIAASAHTGQKIQIL